MHGGSSKNNSKNVFVIAGAIIILISIANIFSSDHKNNYSSRSDLKNKDTYYSSIKEKLNSQQWREAYTFNEEFRDISTALAKNKIRVCGEFHVKLVGSSEYVVACTPDGENWKYFIVWSKTGSVYTPDKETELALSPPY